MPSPHPGGGSRTQEPSQVAEAPPVSHSSLHSTRPLPQVSVLHDPEQPVPSQLATLPSSQASSTPVPGRQSMRPLPHSSLRQARVQPSQSTSLPSSHSSPGSRMWLPHVGSGG